MTLIAGLGTQRVTRDVLATLPLPERTESFQPIAHETLVAELEQSLSFRHISIVEQEYAVSSDGMKMFGFLEVNSEYEGVRFAIGLRNANDKSMRVGIVAGYRVMVCSNMSFHGDFNPLSAKHTKGLNLTESVGVGVDRLQRGWEPLRQAIDKKRETELVEDDARLWIYKAFTDGKMPVSLFKSVHTEFFEKNDQTLWGMENAFTESFKRLTPVSQFEQTGKLGRLLALPA